jgi:hypothetical protein
LAVALAIGFVIFLDLLRTGGCELGFEWILLSAYVPSPLGDTSAAAEFLNRIRAPNSPPGALAAFAWWVPASWTVVSLFLASLVMRRRAAP